MEIENIYQELGIPTSVTKKEDILKAIDEAIKKWQGRVNIPKFASVALDKTAALKRIKAAIEANPSIIKQHAAAYVEIEKRERIQKEIDLKKQGNIFVQNGEIAKEHLTILANKFKLPEQEILQILGAKIKSKQPVINDNDDGVQELERMTMERIDTSLAPLKGPKNLYEFLGVKHNEAATVISTKINAIAKSVSESPDKSNPIISAKKVLCDFCRDLLLNQDKRKRYDKSLENIPFAPIAEWIRNLKAGCAYIDKETFKKLLKEATERGIPLERAKSLIKRTADSIGLPIASEDVSSNMTQCRFCYSLNPKDAKICRTCGMPLTIVCPNCGKTSKEDEMSCTSCNFSFSDMVRAPEYVKHVEAALSCLDPVSAEEGIKQLERVWKTHPQLPSLKKRCAEIQKKYDEELVKLKEFCTKKMYYKANAVMLQLTPSPQMVPLIAEIKSAINEAERLLNEAGQMRDTAARIDKYMQILAVCADCETAKAALLSTPPQAPTAISASAIGNSVQLKWNKLNSQFIEYRIIRKEGGRPSSITDGVRLADTSNTQYDDTTVTPGTSYFYAVYSKCGEVLSRSAAITDRPVLTVCDIDLKKVSYDIQKDSIGFNLEIPKNAKSIEIYRDDRLITTIKGTSYTDTGLVTDREYAYKFVAVYMDCASIQHKSQGVVLRLKALSPPTPVTLNITEGPTNATLSWTPPSKGTLSIFLSQEPLTYHKNDIVNLDTIKLRKLNIAGNSCVISKNFSGEYYFLPLTIQGNVAVVGDIARLVSVIKPSNVKFDRNDSFALVSWSWDHISAVRIEISSDNSSPRHIDLDQKKSASAQYKVTFPATAKSVKVSVRSLVNSSTGGILLSDPVEQVFNLSLVKVFFKDISKAWFSDKYTIEVSADSLLPGGLALLVAENFPPNDLVNIKSYLDIDPSELQPGETLSKSFNYTRKMKGKPIYFRLILADQSLAKMVAILPETRSIK